MRRCVVITVGGTGGHVFPAMALAKELQRADPTLTIRFIGGGLPQNRYAKDCVFPCHDIPYGRISLKGVFKILKGIFTGRHFLKEHSPELVVGFGSYHTFPLLLAALSRNVPVILHEANRTPGKVNRLFAPYAKFIGTLFPDTRLKLRGNPVEAALPLREGYAYGSISLREARAYYGLEPDRPTLLIFGGSQGARSINRVVSEALPQLTQAISLQVIHLTGDESVVDEFKERYRHYGVPASVKSFESRMDLAWQSANLAIGRSGAGTIAEALLFEVPMILIPYPHATENHQEHNADFMVDLIGGARKLCEKELSADRLSAALIDLLQEGGSKLLQMRKAMRLYRETYPQQKLSDLILSVLEKS